MEGGELVTPGSRGLPRGMPEEPSEAGAKPNEMDPETRHALFSLLVMQDTVRWQGPGLALAAQAFLLTIALGKDGTTFTRITAALLAFATAVAALHLVRRKSRQVR